MEKNIWHKREGYIKWKKNVCFLPVISLFKAKLKKNPKLTFSKCYNSIILPVVVYTNM